MDIPDTAVSYSIIPAPQRSQVDTEHHRIDLMAHKSAQRLAVGALSVGAAYWIGVIRMSK